MSSSDLDKVYFSDLGEAGLLCEYFPGPLDDRRQKNIWSIATALNDTVGIRETIPGMNNLVVLYDPFLIEPDALRADIAAKWVLPACTQKRGNRVEIPVIYGGAGGSDLAALSARAGLHPKAFAEKHASATYTVYALGSQPGFGYLAGLPDELATPRRTVVHPRVPSGTVMIGGAQTAVQSRTTPSGWHMIGVTDLRFFDAAQTPPTLLNPGDHVQFKIMEIIHD